MAGDAVERSQLDRARRLAAEIGVEEIWSELPACWRKTGEDG